MLKDIIATLGPPSAKATTAGANTFSLLALLQVGLNIAEQLAGPSADGFLEGFSRGLGTSVSEAGVILGTALGGALLNYVRTWLKPNAPPAR